MNLEGRLVESGAKSPTVTVHCGYKKVSISNGAVQCFLCTDLLFPRLPLEGKGVGIFAASGKGLLALSSISSYIGKPVCDPPSMIFCPSIDGSTTNRTAPQP
jgi:hypothetical protein